MRCRWPVIARAAIASLISACACSDAAPPPERFAVVLRAQRASGEAVAQARVWADGRAIGATSELGILRAELQGREGTAVELTAACPPAYRTEQPTRRLVLRRVQPPAGARPEPLQLTVHCQPLERAAAIVVLTAGRQAGGLPIRVRGEVVGQTEIDGSAHVLIKASPHAPLRVELDTSSRPDLRPRNPVHTFQLGEHDGILLVEQRFTAPAPPNRRARASAPPLRPPQRPQRID